MSKHEHVVIEQYACCPVIWWKPKKILSAKSYPILVDKYFRCYVFMPIITKSLGPYLRST